MQADMRVAQISDDAVPNSTTEEHRLLLARIAEDGDRDAFRVLFLYFGPRVKALMMRAGADREFAEDIMQDVMLTVWKKVHFYAPERGSASAWIYAIARNARIDRLRRGSSRPHEDVSDIDLAIGRGERGGCGRGDAKGRTGRRSARRPCREEQRRIVEYAYMHDLTQSRDRRASSACRSAP